MSNNNNYKSKKKKKKKNDKQNSIIELPLIKDRLARDTARIVRRHFRDVRIVFTSSLSLKDMLVTSSFSKPMCPRERDREWRKRREEVAAMNAGHVMLAFVMVDVS